MYGVLTFRTGLVILYNLYNLARNPDKQELFYQEIVRHAPAGEPLTQESVKKMAYVRAAMKESFRFTPIGVGNARILTKDLHYKGYKIPKEVDEFIYCSGFFSALFYKHR